MHKASVVETSHGRISGILEQGIHSFKGVPYGRDTSGTGRFMRAEPPLPWHGELAAVSLPPQCPQSMEKGVFGATDVMRFMSGAAEPEPYTTSENCLALNIWTPDLSVHRKLPVMVWCHGGGFSQGSGGAPWYDGARLADYGQVVVVSLNHRLGVLGYLHLDGLGDERFSDAGNAGMLDIVLALQWVRENIFRFGGDHNNVTIFGSSGGGCKVSTLMAMPAAKGLFNKAIVMSAVVQRYQPLVGPADWKQSIAERFLGELGLRPGQLADLQRIPIAALHSAMVRVQHAIGDLWGMFVSSPVVDGRVLPSWPFGLSAPLMSTGVPMLIGNTSYEMGPLTGPDIFELAEHDLPMRVMAYMGVRLTEAKQVVDAYRQDYPADKPHEIYFRITADHHFGLDMTHQADLKAGQDGAPVYKYHFAWRAPAFGGRYGAAHGVELPFVFNNIDKAPGLGITPDQGTALRDAMCGAWVAFARNGDPNHELLPRWEPYTPGQRQTMIFDTECRSLPGPGATARLAMLGCPYPRQFPLPAETRP